MNNIAKQCFSYWNITCSREQWYVILRLNAYVIHLSPLTLAHQALDCIRPLVYHQEIADLKLSLAHVGPKNNGPHGPDHNFERFTAQGSIYSIVYGPRLQKIVNFTAQRFIVHLAKGKNAAKVRVKVTALPFNFCAPFFSHKKK